MKKWHQRTYVKEQSVLAACLLPGAILALYLDHTPNGITRTVIAFVLAILGQKIRGAAARQKEADEKAGIEYAVLPCAEKIARWAVVIQWLTIAQYVITSPSIFAFVASLPALVYVQVYSYYRSRRSFFRRID